MGKILIFSDPHSHKHKNSMERLNDCLTVLNWVCTTAIDRGIKKIICCGDLFQDRQKMDVYTYQKTFEVFQKYDNLEFYFLLGNHDLWFADKWDVSSVLPLNALNHVTVIAKPTSTEIYGRKCDWLPYTKNPAKAAESFTDRNDRILFGHIALDGCQLNSSGQLSDVSVEFEGDMVKVDAGVLVDWSMVFLGHYHKAQHVTDKIEYVGSPLQLSFGEAYQDKHIIILDTDSLEKEYIKNTFSPKHLILKEDEMSGIDMLNNYIWVVGDVGKFDAFELSKQAENKKVRNIKFKAKPLKEEITEAVVPKKYNFNDGKALENYIKMVGCGNLRQDKLLQFATSLCTAPQ